MIIINLVITVVAITMLGFGILTAYEKTQDTAAILDRKMDAILERIDRLSDHVMMESEILKAGQDNLIEMDTLVSQEVLELSQTFSEYKRKVIGTADVEEFARLKTAVYGDVKLEDKK